MTTADLLSHNSPEVIWTIFQTGWVVPAGMLALYFYGRFHFNTPEYSLDLAIDSGATTTGAQLITPAPPMFTTRRSRYNRYANRYVLILEAAFIGFIFFYTVVTDIGKVMNLEFPDLSAQSLQYRVILALFALTGLLSSFPVFKEIDIWLLGKLHRAAYIPDDARNLAEQLYRSDFTPAPASVRAVRGNLSMRDTGRVADGAAAGSLERKIVNLLCLRAQIQTSMTSEKLKGFKIKLDRDFRSIGSQAQGLQTDLKSYLRDQERIVPATVPDIDAYIVVNIDNEAVADLARRRQELQSRCDRLYEVICLVVALSLFATEFTPEDIDMAIRQIGFETKVPVVPVTNWDAVLLVTIFTFVLMLAFTGLFVICVYAFNLSNIRGLVPERSTIARFALIYTIAYAIVMSLAIRLKRHWRRNGQRPGGRPENFLIAIYSYALTVPCNLIINGLLYDWVLTFAPLLYALNQAVLGYFIGQYIDRSLKSDRVSLSLALLQGISQATAIEIAALLSPGPGMTLRAVILVGIFSFLQAAVSGFIVGVLFQHFYRQADAREIVNDLQPEAIVAT